MPLMSVQVLKQQHETKREAIEKRLAEFRQVWKKPDKSIFEELCFCLSVPQTSAKRGWAAITELIENGKLYTGSEAEIRETLSRNGVRFCDNKARYICEAREMFMRKNLLNPTGTISIKPTLSQFSDPIQLREWLVQNINGFGYKAASHFMRNIGINDELAILDVHILNNLYHMGVIEKIPQALSKKEYLDIEQKFKAFAKDLGIPIGHLDLVFWSNEAGEIFK